MEELKKYAIIVAGGSGNRMNTSIPKQFLEIGGLPVLMHTINQFNTSSIQIILVLPESQHNYWLELCAKYSFPTKNILLANGGNTRFQSVKNGLEKIKDVEALVAIHDGVRPFITQEIIQESFSVAKKRGNAIVCVPLKESIRLVEGEKSKSADRSTFRIIQTPQCFQLSILRNAYQTEEKSFFTDDASVVEYYGEEIHLIEGDYKNIKITTPEDLLIAEALLKGQ